MKKEMNYNAYKTVFYEVFQNSDYSSKWTNGDIDDMIIGMDPMIEERRLAKLIQDLTS